MSRNRQWFRCALLVLAIWIPLSECGVKLDASAMAQTILYVDDDSPSGGDGSSWDLAFDDLQDALTVASDPKNDVTEIRVGQGGYVPSQRTDEGDARSVTFALINGVTLAGAYAGYGAKDGDERDFEKYVSTLSGDINGDDGPEFANYGENAYHVVMASGVNSTTVLSGFAIVRGSAELNVGWPDTRDSGGGLLFVTGSPTVAQCAFLENRARSGGAIYGRDEGHPTIMHCVFLRNFGFEQGGGLRLRMLADGQTATIADCKFEHNEAANGGGLAVSSDDGGGALTLSGCSFRQNTADLGGGACAISVSSDSSIDDCEFISNTAGLIGGAMMLSEDQWANITIAVSDSAFVGNSADWMAGAVVTGCKSTFTNSLFSDNEAPSAGGIAATVASQSISISSCTIANNSGGGVTRLGADVNLDVTNSIVYGNTPYQLGVDIPDEPPPPASATDPVVNFSLIQGGWTGPGSNNISANPLFVQAGCGNLRLGVGSPCSEAGNNGAIPAGITTDLDGKPRIINGTVDMGAYEGEYEVLPPAACKDDLDEGEFELLVIGGGPNKPDEKPALAVSNDAGGNDTYINVTQVAEDVHSGAGGFNELGHVLSVDTSLPNGAYFMRVSVPFDSSNLNGFDPLDLDLTSFDPASGDWGLAVEFNVQNSPGFKGPVGDRILVEGETWQGSWTFDVGDYGVFWNPSEQRGFAWANVDHATDFAFGVEFPQCAGDVTYPGDRVVNTNDLTVLLDAWGTTPAGPASFADIDHNGVVDVDDLLVVINSWGDCP